MGTNIRTESNHCQELFVLVNSAMIGPMVLNDEKQKFSDRLNLILDKAGIPPKGKGRQGVLADMFDVSDKGARKWIEGEGFPTKSKLALIVSKFSATGVTGEWLLTGNPNYAPNWLLGTNETSQSKGVNETPNGYTVKSKSAARRILDNILDEAERMLDESGLELSEDEQREYYYQAIDFAATEAYPITMVKQYLEHQIKKRKHKTTQH